MSHRLATYLWNAGATFWRIGSMRTITITNGAGEAVTVHAAAVAEIMPGFHVAALAAA